MYSNVLLTIVLLVAAIAAILLLAGSYFYNYAILRRKKEFLQHDEDLKGMNSKGEWVHSKEWLEQQDYKELTINSSDGLKLNAIYLPAAHSSGKVAILVHGYSSWSGSMASFAQYYSQELGYSILMPDLRGHGKSEGKYIGFGWHDRKDMLQWINVMIEKHGSSCQIVLHGVSMGGATVLMTSGEDMPDNVRCIISDCAYSSVEGILGYHMKRMFKLPKFPLLNVTSLISRIRAGYSIKEASALVQVEHACKPILFIHGSEDKFVPAKMVYELYDAAASAKELLVIEGAEHAMSYWVAPAAYKAKVEEFLAKYMKS